ncbi:MAG: signal peptidase I [Firmicutes bacterium]|nr:signal peptidase I [Bacillota bacterium]
MRTVTSQQVGRTREALRRAVRGARDVAAIAIVAVVLAQLVMTSVAQAYQVEQSSMEPTLLPHDRVLVNKLVYRLRAPRPGDVVVLRYPRDPTRNYIKRLVAGPGARVEIRAGQLVIDDRPVEEVYLNGRPTGDWGPEVVPPDSYFVLGDNRNSSEDSRAFGFLRRDQIVGPAMLIYWPPHRVRLLP